MSFSPFDDAHPRYTPTTMFGQPLKHRVVEDAVVKAGKGVLIGWVLHNSGYAEHRVCFYDQKIEPGPTDSIDWEMVLAPGETLTAEFAMGIPFYSGIAYTQTGVITGVLLFA